MGWSDVLLGGLNSSTNPGDYTSGAQYADAGQIHGIINNGLAQVGNRQAPDFRNAQLQQMAQLQGIASGQQQGAGELAVQRQAQQAMAQQQAMAHMARGGNAGMAMLGAQRQGAGIGVNAAGQGQQAAMQDQQGAQGLLASIANSGRSGDMQQMSINDQATMQYLSQLTGMNQAQLSAAMASMQATNSKQGLLGPMMQLGGQLGAAAIAA